MSSDQALRTMRIAIVVVVIVVLIRVAWTQPYALIQLAVCLRVVTIMIDKFVR
jgi:hypothetical protein